MKIYTKNGDQGQTQSWSGQKINKNSLQLEVQGIADELISYLGVIKKDWKDFFKNEEDMPELITDLQNKLFELCAICSSEEKASTVLNITSNVHVEFFEKIIDRYTAKLPPLRNFILPGGDKLSSQVHYCRAKMRTLERRVVELSETNDQLKKVIPFINRCSDVFFIVARFINHELGEEERKVAFNKK